MEEDGPSTWDTKYNETKVSGKIVREAQAFNWKTSDKTGIGGRKIRGTQYYFNKFFRGDSAFINAKNQYAKNKQHYKQFFYSTRKLEEQIKKYKGKYNLDSMVKDSKGNPKK